MSHNFVITLVGSDRPGIVERLASQIFRLGANWEQSRMIRLGGQFAGLVRIHCSSDPGEVFEALQRLESDQMRITITLDRPGAKPPEGRIRVIDLLGGDRPGIIREITATLLALGINVEELETHSLAAPMEGGTLFQASMTVRLPGEVTDEELREKLEAVAANLMVELSVESDESLDG